jgi:hypothetical protein
VSKPVRIQRKRMKGWKKPANTVCITRGTHWGNPFVVRPDLEPGAKIGMSYCAVPTATDAVDTYREMLKHSPDLVKTARKNLLGKNLACYCAEDAPCHGDVLLEIANSQEEITFPEAKEVAFA